MTKYIEIKNKILEKIKSGEYAPGKAIPSERQLAQIYNANRITVRKSLEELMYDDLLISKKGSGTYVKTNKRTKPDEKEKCKVKIINFNNCADNNYGIKFLKLGNGTKYLRLRRARMRGNEPYAYEDIYFNPQYFECIEKADMELSLSDYAEKYIADKTITVKRTVEALLCLKTTANILKVSPNSPILQIKSYYICEDNVALFCRSYHPGDTYCYEVK